MNRGQTETVSRQIDLGYDLDIAHGGIFDQLAHVVLRIITAVALVPLAVARPYGAAPAAVAAHFCQFGMRHYLQAPSLVIRKVQMQLIDLMECEQIYIMLHIIFIHPRAADIEHESAIVVLRLILHKATIRSDGQFGTLVNRCGQQLEESLHAIESSAVGSSRNSNVISRYRQPIRLARQRIVYRQNDISATPGIGRRNGLQRQISSHVTRQPFKRRSIYDPRIGVDRKRALREHMTRRLRNQSRCGGNSRRKRHR